MYKETFPIWIFLPTMFQQDFLKLPFLQQSCQRMTIQILIKEEQLGLPHWTMILAICVVVDESKCLDTPILKNLSASSVFTWVSADTASAACPSQPGILEMISMILAAVI